MTEEMVVRQVKAVMVDLEEAFVSLLLQPTLISLCTSIKKGISTAELGVHQGIQGSEASPFRVILLCLLFEINSSIRHWRSGWGRRQGIRTFSYGG